MQKLLFSVFSTIILISVLGNALPAHAALSAAEKAKIARRKKLVETNRLSQEALGLFKQKRFDEAIDRFTAASKSNPLDPSIEYFIGLSAMYKDDYKLAEKALSKAVVMSPPKGGYALNALKCFDSRRKEFERVRPYSCCYSGTNFWRWSKESQPVGIYLSQGLELPKGYKAQELNSSKLKDLSRLLRDPKHFSRLTPLRHYRSEYGAAVKDGLSEWAWANTEGFLKYQIVDNPAAAHIFVMYCDNFPGGGLPASTTFSANRNDPVIIQFPVEYFYKLPLHMWPTVIKSIACHEFGHAFGLQHSEFKRDIMFPTDKIKWVNRGTDQSGPNIVTPNDAASLRALYDLPAPVLK